MRYTDIVYILIQKNFLQFSHQFICLSFNSLFNFYMDTTGLKENNYFHIKSGNWQRIGIWQYRGSLLQRLFARSVIEK